MTSARPLVSVCVVTYNQQDFIGACLRSILEQDAPFEFEVLVADDASTDRTAEVLTEFASADTRVRVIRQPTNIGPTQNLLLVHNAAQGEFVAHIDGDDLMAPGKLARQAELLEREKDLAACGHRMALIDEAGAAKGVVYPKRLAERFDLNRLIRVGMPVFASSVMYRAGRRRLRASESDLFDWFILTDVLENGDAGYIAETLGYYRVNSQSMVSTYGRQNMIEFMSGLYLRRLSDWPERRAEFFAHAVWTAVFEIGKSRRLDGNTRELLRKSATISAAIPLLDAFIWSVENRASYVR